MTVEKKILGTIYPTVLAVPHADRQLKGKAKVKSLSRHARTALKLSARRSGVRLGALIKDKRGAPVMADGVYWSIAHKGMYTAGVVGTSSVGIDLERVKPVSEALYQKVADQKEWSLGHVAGHEDWLHLFFRFWTAKEAVLKTGGAGLADLSRCKIDTIVNHKTLIIHYRSHSWEVDHLFFDGHMAAVAGKRLRVEWRIV